MPRISAYDKAPRIVADQVENLTERVILIRRVSKVTAGGKNMRFNAMVAVGDSQSIVGIGMGKANAVPDAVRKGVAIARKNLIQVPLNGTTIPHSIISKFRASTVLMKPARPGTGVVAGATVRAVMDLAGVKDVVTKVLSSTNPINLSKATLEGLSQLRDPESESRIRRFGEQSVVKSLDVSTGS